MIDIYFVWKYWAFEWKIGRWNSGNPYYSYSFGPLRIRRFIRVEKDTRRR